MKTTVAAKFSELPNFSKFVHAGKNYTKVAERQAEIKGCCNNSQKTKVNAEREDGNPVYFGANEVVNVCGV